jgi:hypothetical protein
VLTLEQVLQGDLGTASSSSDSSSSVTSSILADNDFLNISSFVPLGNFPILGLHGNLSSIVLPQNDRASSSSTHEDHAVDNSMALVPSVPLLPNIVLRVWSFCLEQSLAQHLSVTTEQMDCRSAAQSSPIQSTSNTLSLPRRISRTRTLTPLVTTSLRRSVLTPDFGTCQGGVL